MMDVLIRGCSDHLLKVLRRHADCEVRVLPPHGDLIEADVLRELAYERGEKHGCVAFVDALDITLGPVIIPSNKEDTE